MDSNINNSKGTPKKFGVSPSVQIINSLSPEATTTLSEFGNEKADSNYNNYNNVKGFLKQCKVSLSDQKINFLSSTMKNNRFKINKQKFVKITSKCKIFIIDFH